MLLKALVGTLAEVIAQALEARHKSLELAFQAIGPLPGVQRPDGLSSAFNTNLVSCAHCALPINRDGVLAAHAVSTAM